MSHYLLLTYYCIIKLQQIFPYLRRSIVKVRIKFMNDGTVFIDSMHSYLVRIVDKTMNDVAANTDPSPTVKSVVFVIFIIAASSIAAIYDHIIYR